MHLRILAVVSALLLVTAVSSRSQQLRHGFFAPGQQPLPSRESIRPIFESIEQGLVDAAPEDFSAHLGSQVLLNLRGAESGYYSSSQAFYVLQNYLRGHRPTHVRFSTFGDADGAPYGTGSVTFHVRGTREIAQVYVSLASAGDRWVIAQFNIY